MAEDKKKIEEEPEGQEEWKVRFKDGTVFAPVTYDNLVEWYKSGQIEEETPVARNALTAEWLQFKDTEGFAVAKAAKEGREVFCTSCGTPWPVGTKLCTKCGTFLETGEKIAAVGEKKPERALKLPSKGKKAEPERKEGVAEEGEVAGAAEAGGVVEAPAGEEVVEMAEAEEEAVAARPRKRSWKVIRLVIAVAAVVAAAAVLAPEKISDVLEKAKRMVGLGGKGAKGKEEKPTEWAGVREDVRSAIEGVQARLSSALKSVPFAERERAGFEGKAAEFLRGAVEEFTDTDAFVSLATTLGEGDLKGAARFLEEEKGLLGTEASTPRIDAIRGGVEVLLGNEKKGRQLLASAVEDLDVARGAASFVRGAMEGCLERVLLARGREDPWGSVAEILGMKKEEIGDEFLAGHCGKVLSGLTAMGALTSESPGGGSKVGVRASMGPLLRRNPSVQAALVELGKVDPSGERSVLKENAVRAAYVLRLMAEERRGESDRGDRLVEVLKEGLSAEPENAFYNYALAAAYLGMKKDKEAIAEIAAGNEKAIYRDYSKERMEGLARVLDTPLPYTAAVTRLSCPQLSALARSSRRLSDSAGSFFRVGRRKETFEMLGEWRKACERLRKEVCTFRDALMVMNASVPCTALEAQLYERDGRRWEAWSVRKKLAEDWRLLMAMDNWAQYGVSAVAFVKEVLSEGGYEKEFSQGSPQETFAELWLRATQRLDGILREAPGSVPTKGANLQDRRYVAAKRFFDEGKYERAFAFANACLAENPKHVWALKVMEDAVSRASVEAGASRTKAVAYMLVRKKDMSVPGAKRVEYEIEVAKGTSEEKAVATARAALQGFLRREKPDAVRIYVMPEGSRLPSVRLDWAPGGDWEKAKGGTPYAEFAEKLRVFNKGQP